MALRLGYWNIRGLAQTSRYLLEYSGLAWTDELYCQAGPDAPIPFDKSCWFDVKPTIGLAFPNLPYLIDGDFKITQSQAIIRYIARKRQDLNLLGSNDKEMALVDMLLGEYSDKKGKMTTLQYNAGLEGAGEQYITGDSSDDLKGALKQFETFLGENTWFVGNHVTVVDFALYEFSEQAFEYARRLGLNYRELFPSLSAFTDRVRALPAIATYLASDRFQAITGYNNQHAKFR